jgi:uncharacterized protein
VDLARRTKMLVALGLALAVLLAAATALLVVNLFQADMLFPVHAVPRAGPLPAGAERLELKREGGERLHGVYFPPSGHEAGPRTLIIGFGGNAWNGQDVATYLHRVYPDAHVVAFHYRGYAPSTGSPSAQALKDDAPLVYDLAVERIRPDQIVAVGMSIGSGVAANLSGQRKLDGLILVTPFDSLKRVAGNLFPWLPVGFFFQHELAAADDLKGGSTPIAILAAERDGIVLPARTESLRREAPNVVFDQTFAGAGHNDVYQRSDFEVGLRAALKSVVEAKK